MRISDWSSDVCSSDLFFRNNTDDLKIKSYGLFGEAYFEVSDRLKLTAGLRYNNDKKTVIARSTLAAFLAPHGGDGTVFDSPFVPTFDADQIGRASCRERVGQSV